MVISRHTKNEMFQDIAYQYFIVARVFRSVFKVHADQMFRHSSIVHFINSIKHKIYEIESRKKGRWKVDILRNWEVRVVLAADGIG